MWRTHACHPRRPRVRDVRTQRLASDHAVVAEREDPEGHDLFREVRVRPFVGIALREQLEGGARVIDLVEVHVARRSSR